MSRKMTMLTMVVGALAVLALPASASATWKHGDVTPIPADVVNVGLTGQIGFQSHALGGGVTCQVTSALDFTAGQTTGLITSFKAHPTSDTANCHGQGGLAFCQIHNQTPTGLSPHGNGWVIHTRGTQAPTIEITHGDIHAQATGFFCPVSQITVTAGTVTAVPNPANGITVTGATIQGTAVTDTTLGQDPAATVHGSFVVEAPNSGTYSI